jgi:hypothetical protein
MAIKPAQMVGAVRSNQHVARSFEELVDAAVAAPIEGWDFSWLEGRAIEERPS